MNQKLKAIFILICLLSTYSNATCTKQDVMKLIEKDFSKTEINSICDIQAKLESNWINPTRRACTKNGGKLKGGICEANWRNAKRICSEVGGRLPNINELKSVVDDCGGEVKDSVNNENDSAYQACYKRKGFSSSDYYWSSSLYTSDTKGGWIMYFKYGFMDFNLKTFESYVRCVRGR